LSPKIANLSIEKQNTLRQKIIINIFFLKQFFAMWGQLFFKNFRGFWFFNVIQLNLVFSKIYCHFFHLTKLEKIKSLIVIVFYSNSKHYYEISILGTIFFFYDEQNLFMQLTCSHLTIDIKMTVQVDWKLHTW
jgi:hypothetical protein